MKALTITKFMGASVINISSSANWQEQVSQMKVDLVEDTVNGDVFITPEVGTPVSLIYEGLRFDGIVQSWSREESESGFVYSVLVHSPVEILENVAVLLDAYRGINTIVPNLINAFGYLEKGGASFGGSQKNQSGIPWRLLLAAINACQKGGTKYSTGITFKNHKYYVDLSSLPVTPDFYRIGMGVSANLSTIIQQVCRDSAYDYITLLEKNEGFGPHRIYFITRNRQTYQPPGMIQQFAKLQEDINNLEYGEESSI